jgi:hypothetical protein
MLKLFSCSAPVGALVAISLLLTVAVLIRLVVRRDNKINALNGLLVAFNDLSSEHPEDFEEAIIDTEDACDCVVESFDNEDAMTVRELSYKFIQYMLEANGVLPLSQAPSEHKGNNND